MKKRTKKARPVGPPPEWMIQGWCDEKNAVTDQQRQERARQAGDQRGATATEHECK